MLTRVKSIFSPLVGFFNWLLSFLFIRSKDPSAVSSAQFVADASTLITFTAATTDVTHTGELPANPPPIAQTTATPDKSYTDVPLVTPIVQRQATAPSPGRFHADAPVGGTPTAQTTTALAGFSSQNLPYKVLPLIVPKAEEIDSTCSDLTATKTRTLIDVATELGNKISEAIGVKDVDSDQKLILDYEMDPEKRALMIEKLNGREILKLEKELINKSSEIDSTISLEDLNQLKVIFRNKIRITGSANSYVYELANQEYGCKGINASPYVIPLRKMEAKVYNKIRMLQQVESKVLS